MAFIIYIIRSFPFPLLLFNTEGNNQTFLGVVGASNTVCRLIIWNFIDFEKIKLICKKLVEVNFSNE